MDRIGEERRLISFDQMAEPCQRERGGNQQQANDPVKPDYDKRRESDRNGNHVQRAIYRMVVRAVIV